MKLAKSLLLGSAAGLCAVSGVQAADLPMRKAAPVEYVRVCTAFGAGFFFIPGTDTCIRVGGRARFEYQYTSQRAARDVSGFRAIGRLNLDARTQTAYGALRTFVRFDIMSRSGAYLTSGTAQRYAFAFPALGQDTFGRTQKHVDIEKAFIQFAGITAGRAASFFDFYATDFEFINANIVSNVSSTNLLAYTATFGGGFSATVSAEDPVFRRNPVFAPFVNATGSGATNVGGAFLPLGSGAVSLGNNSAFSPVLVPNGVPSNFAFIDVAQRSRMPDFVGALRYDAAWGSAQVMGAVHEIALGAASTAGATGVFSSTGGPIGVPAARRIDNFEYGFAVGGGLKFNLPQIAPGDQLFLQVAYAQGAGSYTGMFNPQGAELQGSSYTGRSSFPGIDSALRIDGRQELTETYSANIAFLHYWTPEVRQAIFGSHARAHFDKSLRGTASPAIGTFATGAGGIAAGGFFSPLFKDYTNTYVGTNLAYSPVRDLDFGVEVVYERLEFLGGASRGRVADLNKFPTQPTTQAGAIRTIKVDDNILVRLRVQRDF